MKLRDKIHAFLQEKALDKAIKQLIGDIGEYYIFEDKLLFKIEEEKIKLLNELDFILPSWEEIAKVAKTIYKNFDKKVATKVVYEFGYLAQEKDLVVSAENSDIALGFNNFTNLIIKNADNVKIYADTLEDGGMSINAKNIEFMRIHSCIKENINLVSESVEFYNSNLVVLKNIYINSKLLEFDETEIMYSENIYLKSDLIVAEKSKLKAQNKIEIINTNCDEISGIEAPTIIYNGQDITYSEGIVMPKLREQLLNHLREIRNNVTRDIDNKVKESAHKQKESLESKPITKILKK